MVRNAATRRWLGAVALFVAMLCGVLAFLGLTARRPSASATGDPFIVAGGDIACDPADSNFNAGKGTSANCRQLATSNLLSGAAAVLPLGDNQYYCGSYSAYTQSYDLSWGRYKSLTHPAVGNHEYLTTGGSGAATGCTTANAGAAGYYQYFGSAAGQSGQGYYSYNVGTWHLIALNSNCGDAGGCSSSSPQGKWLTADLAAHANMCTLAYWHIPLFDTGNYASPNSQSFWNSLSASHADVILNGHDHNYQRYAPQTPGGVIDQTNGIREFIVGTGGANLISYGTSAGNTEVRNNTTFGVLKLTLHAGSYDWQFVPEAGKTFTDSGTKACHASGGGADTTPPTAPGSLTATAASPTQVNLAWAASTDNVGVNGYRILRGGTQIGTSTTTNYSDPSALASTMYSYTVVATDAAGNASGPSNTATVTTPASGSVLSFTPTDDSYAANDTPSAVHGTETQVIADNSPVKHMFVRFSVSGTSGRPVQSAKLRLYCVDPSAMGGEFHGSSTTWSQSTLTWNLQPTINAPVLGTLGAVATNTWYEVDVTPLVTGDGAVSVAGISTSTDGAHFSSKEGSATLMPQLLVTLGTADTTKPTAPTGLSATQAANSTVHLGWTGSTDNVGVTGYRVSRTAGATTTTSNIGVVTTYDDTTAVPGTAYSYTVAALDAAGNVSLASNTAPITAADTTVPSAPSGLSATQAANSTVHLSWTGSTDNVAVASYRVSWTAGPTTTTFNAALATTYDDTTAVPGAAYSYTVAALDAAGNVSLASNTAPITAADTTKPTAPTGLSASPGTALAVHLSWTGSTDNVAVTSYRVSRTSGANTTTFNAGLATTYDDTTAVPATAYTYTVAALDAASNASLESNTATWTPDTTLPSTPANFVAGQGDNTGVHLTWDASTDNVGVTGYKLTRDDGTAPVTTIDAGLVVAYDDSDLNPGTTYTYTVAA